MNAICTPCLALRSTRCFSECLYWVQPISSSQTWALNTQVQPCHFRAEVRSSHRGFLRCWNGAGQAPEALHRRRQCLASSRGLPWSPSLLPRSSPRLCLSLSSAHPCLSHLSTGFSTRALFLLLSWPLTSISNSSVLCILPPPSE